MAKQLPHIGTIELVSLPNGKLFNIPAKIDTGADSSAIWASGMKVKDGKLSFRFFAPGSAYYRKKSVVTTAYQMVNVKNSFGQGEKRYKIKLKIQIGEITVTEWFTLADRSRNKFPILLGKNFLENRFVVDVSKRYEHSKAEPVQRIVVIGSLMSKDFFANKVSKLNEEPTEYKCVGYQGMVFKIDGHNTHIVNEVDEAGDLADYDAAYFKTHTKHAEFTSAIASYLQFKGRMVFDHEVSSNVSASKLSEYMRLNCFGVPVPKTICARTPVLKTLFPHVEAELDLPFVLKEIYSDRGRNNYLIKSEKDFKRILDKAPADHVYLAQKYIPNDGFIRVHVFGKEAVLGVWRATHEHKDPLKSHLNKPSGGANASQFDLSKKPELRDLAYRAANCMDRQIAGVDLVQDKATKKWYILEVNSAPQLRSGSFTDEKAAALARFFDRALGR